MKFNTVKVIPLAPWDIPLLQRAQKRWEVAEQFANETRGALNTQLKGVSGELAEGQFADLAKDGKSVEILERDLGGPKEDLR